MEIVCDSSVVGTGLFCPVTHRKMRKTQGERSREAQLPHGKRSLRAHNPSISIPLCWEWGRSCPALPKLYWLEPVSRRNL